MQVLEAEITGGMRIIWETNSNSKRAVVQHERLLLKGTLDM